MTGKKFGISLILNVVIKIGAVGLGILTARWANNNFSEGEYFEYNAIIAYTSVILAVINFGLPVILQKYYTNQDNKDRRNQVWNTLMIVRIFTFFLGLGIIFFTYSFSGSNNLALISAFFVVQFVLVADAHYRAVCDAEGRSWQFSIGDFVARFLVVMVLYIGLTMPQLNINLWFLVYTLFVGYLINYSIDFVWQYKYTNFAKPDFSIIKEQFRPMFFLSLATISFALYNSTDKLFIANLGFPQSDLNSYANGYKIYESAMIVPGITAPMLASYMKRRFDQKILGPIAKFLQKKVPDITFNKSFFTEWGIISLVIGFGLFLGMIIVGPVLLWLIDPNNLYPKALEVIPIFALAIFTTPISGILAYFIIFNTNGEKYEFIGSIFLVFVALFSYSLLIPRFGVLGAAWSTCIYFFFDLFIKIFLLNKVLKQT